MPNILGGKGNPFRNETERLNFKIRFFQKENKAVKGERKFLCQFKE